MLLYNISRFSQNSIKHLIYIYLLILIFLNPKYKVKSSLTESIITVKELFIPISKHCNFIYPVSMIHKSFQGYL